MFNVLNEKTSRPSKKESTESPKAGGSNKFALGKQILAQQTSLNWGDDESDGEFDPVAMMKANRGTKADASQHTDEEEEAEESESEEEEAEESESEEEEEPAPTKEAAAVPKAVVQAPKKPPAPPQRQLSKKEKKKKEMEELEKILSELGVEPKDAASAPGEEATEDAGEAGDVSAKEDEGEEKSGGDKKKKKKKKKKESSDKDLVAAAPAAGEEATGGSVKDIKEVLTKVKASKSGKKGPKSDAVVMAEKEAKLKPKTKKKDKSHYNQMPTR